MSADLLKRLAEAGTPLDLVMEVAETLAEARAAERLLEKRRAKDRQRKRNSADSAETTENAETVEIPSPFTPPKKAPEPQKITPPISPIPGELSAEPTDPPLTAKEIVEAWNERMAPQGFPPVKRLTGTRQRQLTARLRENTIDDWQRAMSALERSAFCRGENDRGWRADFDFLIQPKSFTKLLEGAYDH
jgi:hypothetical protein